MRSIFSLAVVFFVGILSGRAVAAPSTLDSLAHQYVVLVAQAARIEPGSFDVSGDLHSIARRAKTHPIGRQEVVRRLGLLASRLDSLPPSTDALVAMRQRNLKAHAVSLALQLQPAKMAALPVAGRVQRIYGFEPIFRPLTTFDPAIERLEKAMPGEGSLTDRIDAMKKRAEVPADRIEAVVRTAVAECRRRTATHMALPKEELEISFPADPLVPGRSDYHGNGKGTMAVSTVVPADVDRLLQLSCHEAYPGHHTNYATLDQRLWRGKGWPEVRSSLNMEPQFPVSDAISEYGVGMVFPLDDRMKFEREVLYPLAGLRMQDEPAWRAYISARSSVLGATSTVIRDYLDHKIDADTAKKLSIRYRLMNPRSAEQLLKMVDAFGVDIIASDQGWEAIDRAFNGKGIDEQWRLLQRMEAEPMLLGDVRALATAH
jgi:hypothetical protein